MTYKIVGADENSDFPPRVEAKLATKFADINTPMTPGPEGDSAYDVAVTNGFVGSEAQWLTSLVGPQGIKGDPGTNGTNGSDGADGIDGDSAYQIALDEGFVGTEIEWLASLKGEKGDGYTLQEDPGDEGFFIF
jgi:hypothetical protein